MKRNKFLKWLRKEADKLPPEQYTAIHKLNAPTFVEAEEGDEDLTKTDGEGNERRYKMVNVVQEAHPVNHYRRLKRGFSTKGFAFINNYFETRGFKQENQIKNGESKQAEETSV